MPSSRITYQVCTIAGRIWEKYNIDLLKRVWSEIRTEFMVAVALVRPTQDPPGTCPRYCQADMRQHSTVSGATELEQVLHINQNEP